MTATYHLLARLRAIKAIARDLTDCDEIPDDESRQWAAALARWEERLAAAVDAAMVD